MKLAVIGKDVSQSLSPQMHSFIAERTGNTIIYDKISLDKDAFQANVARLFDEYDGFNVTIPYKVDIIPYLKEILGDAADYGSVNTVRSFDRTGHNTDGAGFALMLRNNGVDVKGRKALLLGAGGAGRSVAKKLKEGGAQVFVYDKLVENAKKVAAELDVTQIDEIDLTPYYVIINATGVGMHNTVGRSPVGDKLLALCEVAVDLIYTPPESEFLRLARTAGKKTVNGLAMLFYQAYYAQCIYFGCAPDDGQAKQLFEEYKAINEDKEEV